MDSGFFAQCALLVIFVAQDTSMLMHAWVSPVISKRKRMDFVQGLYIYTSCYVLHCKHYQIKEVTSAY